MNNNKHSYEYKGYKSTTPSHSTIALYLNIIGLGLLTLIWSVLIIPVVVKTIGWGSVFVIPVISFSILNCWFLILKR